MTSLTDLNFTKSEKPKMAKLGQLMLVSKLIADWRMKKEWRKNEGMNEWNIFFFDKYTNYVQIHPYYFKYSIYFSKRCWEDILQVYVGGCQEKILKRLSSSIPFGILIEMCQDKQKRQN